MVATLHAELDRQGRPTLLVVEDVHWADDATLDVLRYLVRRLDALPVVLLLTYRDDELTGSHPLRSLLGLAATVDQTRRLPLERLSPSAVSTLSAGVDVDAGEVFTVTSGNPFFVQQVLAAPGQGVPPTVVDAVLARLRRVDPAARAGVERLSVIPSALHRWLVDALVPGGLATLADAEEHGLLAVTPTRVTFRHELTRRAIVDALPTSVRATHDAAVLRVLESSDSADLAQLVHHAAEAGDTAAVVRYGPAAARAAAAGGAHREAAAHYRLVLEQQDAFALDELADLLEASAVEHYMVGDHGRVAVADQAEAVALRRTLGDSARLGASLRWLSRMRWWSGDRPGAEAAGAECVAVLEATGDKRLVAMAMSNQSQLAMLARRNDEAIPAAERAAVLAREVGDAETLSHALNNLGTSRWARGEDEGRALVEESLEVALAAGRSEHATRAYVNLIWQLLDDCRADEAAVLIGPAIALADQAEHVAFWKYLHVERAMIALAGSRWDDVSDDARKGLDATDPIRCAALITLGRAALRSGGTAKSYVDEAWPLSQRLDELQRLVPAANLVSEAAYLSGDLATIRATGGPVFQEARRLRAVFDLPELGFWLTVAGVPVDIAETRSRQLPYAALARGDWRRAADLWEEAGYPYEHAFALTRSDELDVVLDGLARLDALGAVPMARHVRAQLRTQGIARVPRGPAAATRVNLAGLTNRQLEVLGLLSAGLPNAEIAERLVLSVRTVDHHVAAVLQKLGARTRADAVQKATALGWVPAARPG